jgi:hypothetical protein
MTAITDSARDSSILQKGSHELNRMFLESPPGPIPVGRTAGTALLVPGTLENESLARLIMLFAWKGKTFDDDGTMLSNRITALDLSAIRAKVSKGLSWVDEAECIVLDYSRTSMVASGVRDEIRLVAPGLYLGVIWLWGRRVGWFTLRAPEAT